ncbi:hypothetical protein Ctob_005383 [Chrysochromulina tobinii]|uniref:Uncharacterized protein n=1 Tax=Chrysochromulina tobinii TaxID=1460289 RepID=A0A0M0J7N3_9EUKA|nr:hypothetical protein Ctob_005383 [Chrysochromulina tobinii]|eukprot:KOO22455.1 hypothetical protein Ctob_005383 [Chrysochromulina sp. CCMP291]
MEHEEAPQSDAPHVTTSAVEVIIALTAARTPLPLALLAPLREMVMVLLRELVMELVIPPEAAVPGATLMFTLYAPPKTVIAPVAPGTALMAEGDGGDASAAAGGALLSSALIKASMSSSRQRNSRCCLLC